MFYSSYPVCAPFTSCLPCLDTSVFRWQDNKKAGHRNSYIWQVNSDYIFLFFAVVGLGLSFIWLGLIQSYPELWKLRSNRADFEDLVVSIFEYNFGPLLNYNNLPHKTHFIWLNMIWIVIRILYIYINYIWSLKEPVLLTSSTGVCQASFRSSWSNKIEIEPFFS